MHKTQEIFLKAISGNPNISIRQLGALVGINTSTAVVRYHVNALIKAGKIAKGTKWVVLANAPKIRQNKSKLENK